MSIPILRLVTSTLEIVIKSICGGKLMAALLNVGTYIVSAALYLQFPSREKGCAPFSDETFHHKYPPSDFSTFFIMGLGLYDWENSSTVLSNWEKSIIL